MMYFSVEHCFLWKVVSFVTTDSLEWVHPSQVWYEKACSKGFAQLHGWWIKRQVFGYSQQRSWLWGSCHARPDWSVTFLPWCKAQWLWHLFVQCLGRTSSLNDFTWPSEGKSPFIYLHTQSLVESSSLAKRNVSGFHPARQWKERLFSSPLIAITSYCNLLPQGNEKCRLGALAWIMWEVRQHWPCNLWCYSKLHFNPHSSLMTYLTRK